MATQPAYIYGDTVNAVLNTARSRVDDLILTPSGSPTGSDPGQQQTQVGGAALLAELNSDGTLALRTQIIFNSAWRKFQRYLLNLGWRGFIQSITISNMPANLNPDVTIQSWLSWNGCFDGGAFTATPALPETFIAPIYLRERVHGSPAAFEPMATSLNGLRNVPRRSALNRQWEWRDNALYFIGASVATDLQIRCTKLFPDFVATTAPVTPWYYQLLPIPGCLSALAWYVAYEVCFPRGDAPGAAATLAMAQDEANELFNDQARIDQTTKTITESPKQATTAPVMGAQ